MIDVELTTYDDLDERVVILRAGEEVDAVFVRTARFNVLVDTLSTPTLCARVLELLGDQCADRPLLVINSHMDWDHFWGNAALEPGTPIIAHSQALQRLQSPEAKAELAQKRTEEHRFQEVELVPPTMTFSHGQMSLHGGDLTLDLIHAPGHTPDHVAVWIPEIKVCLAVDAAEHPIPEVWSASPADLQDLCASLKRIRSLKPRHLILAHGQTSDPATVDRNLAYFTNVRDAVERNPDAAAGPASKDPPSGFLLEDFVTLPPDMPEDTRSFYRQCHRSNFNAVTAAFRKRVDFI